MSGFDFLMVALIGFALFFGALHVRQQQKIKMLKYSLQNAIAAHNKLKALVDEHGKCWKLVNKKLSNLGQ